MGALFRRLDGWLFALLLLLAAAAIGYLSTRYAHEADWTANGRTSLSAESRAVLARLHGPVEIVSEAEADAYYATRPRGSRIGAWASKQSRPLESRFALEKAVAEYTARYAIGDIPRPKHWSGFRIVPQTIEFWHDRPFRLHDRVVFSRNGKGGWGKTRLYP